MGSRLGWGNPQMKKTGYTEQNRKVWRRERFHYNFFNAKCVENLVVLWYQKKTISPPKLIFLGVILFFSRLTTAKRKKYIISDRCAQLDENISYFISEISRNNSGCHWCRKHRVRQTRIFFRCFISRTRLVNQYEPKTCTFCYQLTRDQTKSASEIR